MLKRVRWMAAGAVAGSAATVWAELRVRRALARATPEQLGPAAAARARAWQRELATALDEGRAAMHEREAELRQRYLRSVPAPTPAPDGTTRAARPTRRAQQPGARGRLARRAVAAAPRAIGTGHPSGGPIGLRLVRSDGPPAPEPAPAPERTPASGGVAGSDDAP